MQPLLLEKRTAKLCLFVASRNTATTALMSTCVLTCSTVQELKFLLLFRLLK